MKTMKAVFSQKPNSKYDDVTGERYNFPKQYKKRIDATLGDHIIYYEQLAGKNGRFYTGLARVASIGSDPNTEGRFYAYLDDFLSFDRLVEYRENGGYESKLVSKDGSVNGGHALSAVRHITDREFARIVEAGLSTPDEWPDRYDEVEEHSTGFGETIQAEYDTENFVRPIVQQITNRKWRDAKFRQNVRVAYNRTCAFTGLCLINGRGRPEVEAAHIKPVECGGNDWIRNGIALSGTVHWMFDRGLLSLSDDFTILQSRHNNHDISHLLNADLKAKVPTDGNLQPHPEYLRWHRNERFKQ